jgi:hypothetical protein
VKALNLVAGWKGSLEQQRAHDIVGGANHALDLATMRGGVGAQHPELDVVGEEGAEGVIEPSSIIALDASNEYNHQE